MSQGPYCSIEYIDDTSRSNRRCGAEKCTVEYPNWKGSSQVPWNFLTLPEVYCILCIVSRELLARRIKALDRLFLHRIRVVGVQIVQRELQKLLLILPRHLALRKILAVCWWRRWVRNLGDQVRGGRFRNAVDQDSQERYLEKDVEADTEAKEHPLTVVEPVFLLLFSELYPREVGFQLCCCQLFSAEIEDE